MILLNEPAELEKFAIFPPTNLSCLLATMSIRVTSIYLWYKATSFDVLPPARKL